MESYVLPHDHGKRNGSEIIFEALSHPALFAGVAEVFRQLGDPNRVRIFWLLCHREDCVINLSAILHMSSPAVSHHLRPLRDNGFIVSRREGKEMYYRAADTAKASLLHGMIEQVMDVNCPETDKSELPATQAETAEKTHQFLVDHLSERITIESLSKMFLIDPTTLKKAFKEKYGSSLANHIKEHRMEKAAALLLQGNQSVAEIAHSVGYDSQSRFSEAFRSYYGKLPSEYRKGNKS